MARTFSATTDLLNSGHGASISTLGTMTALAWVYNTAVSAAPRIFQKGISSNGAYNYLLINPTNSNFEHTVHLATTDLSVRANGVNMPQYALNKWLFVACQHNVAGANTDQHLWSGDLTHAVAEAASYTTQTVGAGAQPSDATLDLIVGNKSNIGSEWQGAIAWLGIWNRALSLAEIQQQQFHPHPTSGCVLFMHLLGFGTEIDLSGNGNNGTVTGTTISAHVPLGPLFGLDALHSAVAAAVAALQIPLMRMLRGVGV